MTIKAVGLFAGGPAVGGAGRVQQVREGGAGQEDHPAALPLPEQGPLHTPHQQDRHHSQVIIWPVINCLFFVPITFFVKTLVYFLKLLFCLEY